jgi:hypothetical protein
MSGWSLVFNCPQRFQRSFLGFGDACDSGDVHAFVGAIAS